MKANKINGIGAINMKNVRVETAGIFEVHINLVKIDESVNVIIDDCMERYKKSYPDVDTENDVYFNFFVVHNFNFDCVPEFSASVYVWQKSDEETGKCTCECYEEYKLDLDEESKKAIKKIIWKNLKKTLFDL